MRAPPLIFDVLKANDKNEHDAADIVCAECKSIIAQRVVIERLNIVKRHSKPRIARSGGKTEWLVSKNG